MSLPFLDRWIDHATRHGGSKKRYEHLDGWRGIAIVIVLWSHFSPTTFALPFEGSLLGRLGVDFFFVLSGLLMANILFVKRTPLSTFYKRRISRIFPVFMLYVVLIYGYAWFFTNSSEAKNIWSAITFMRGYFPLEADIWRIDLPATQLWSLYVEEHCYIILSLITLIAAFKKREYWPLFGLGLAAIVIRYLYVRYPDLTSGRFSIRTETAASHLMVSAGYFMIRRRFDFKPPGILVLLAILAGVASYSIYAPWFASWLLAPFFLAFAVNHADRLPPFALSALCFRPLQLIGIWSYSIYLWQEPFYFYLKELDRTSMVNCFGMLIAAILCGVCSFYLLENPVRRWLNRTW